VVRELPLALALLRSRKNQSTGRTPASLVLRFEIPIPEEWKINRDRKGRQAKTSSERNRENQQALAHHSNFNQWHYPERQNQPLVQF